MKYPTFGPSIKPDQQYWFLRFPNHLSQAWAQAIAAHFDIKNVFKYSGGTKATALFPMAAKTLENQILKSYRKKNMGNAVIKERLNYCMSFPK